METSARDAAGFYVTRQGSERLAMLDEALTVDEHRAIKRHRLGELGLTPRAEKALGKLLKKWTRKSLAAWLAQIIKEGRLHKIDSVLPELWLVHDVPGFRRFVEKFSDLSGDETAGAPNLSFFRMGLIYYARLYLAGMLKEIRPTSARFGGADATIFDGALKPVFFVSRWASSGARDASYPDLFRQIENAYQLAGHVTVVTHYNTNGLWDALNQHRVPVPVEVLKVASLDDLSLISGDWAGIWAFDTYGAPERSDQEKERNRLAEDFLGNHEFLAEAFRQLDPDSIATNSLGRLLYLWRHYPANSSGSKLQNASNHSSASSLSTALQSGFVSDRDAPWVVRNLDDVFDVDPTGARKWLNRLVNLSEAEQSDRKISNVRAHIRNLQVYGRLKQDGVLHKVAPSLNGFRPDALIVENDMRKAVFIVGSLYPSEHLCRWLEHARAGTDMPIVVISRKPELEGLREISGFGPLEVDHVRSDASSRERLASVTKDGVVTEHKVPGNGMRKFHRH